MSEMARNASPDNSPEDQNLQAQDHGQDDEPDGGHRAATARAKTLRAMLDQMQQMFENMRSAPGRTRKPGQTRDAQADRRNSRNFLRDQQALRDGTFPQLTQEGPSRASEGGATNRRQIQDLQGQQDQDQDGSNAPDQGDKDKKSDRTEQGQDQGRTRANRSSKIASGTARPPRRIAAQAEKPRDEGREGLRRRGQGRR